MRRKELETWRRDNTFEEFCCKRVEKWDKRWGCEVKGGFFVLFLNGRNDICVPMGKFQEGEKNERSRKEKTASGKRKWSPWVRKRVPSR